MTCSLQELVCQINRKQGLNCGIFQKRNPNCKFWSVQELHVLSLNGYKTHGLNRGIFQVRVHVLTSGRVQELHVVTRTRTTKTRQRTSLSLWEIFGCVFLTVREGGRSKRERNPRKERCQDKQKILYRFSLQRFHLFLTHNLALSRRLLHHHQQCLLTRIVKESLERM